MSYNDWQCVIGLEVHAQLKTRSKLFSGDSTQFGSAINENVAPVSIGLPGALPVLNKQAVYLAIKTGLALNCDVQNISVFSRKNYFYPDLSKGYQISQFDKPICKNGFVEFYIDEKIHRVHLERAHLEEDAGKSNHFGEYTLIDYNRAGIPLLEIVTKPEINSAREAAEFMRAVRNILRCVDTCHGNLEEGSLRCDCNVSVRKKDDDQLGTRVEIKNLNSFRFVEKAIEYEIHRQVDVLESGDEVEQETRLFDHVKGRTFTMRKKEAAHDYRYFPDPDLLPLVISQQQIDDVKKEIPHLPLQKAKLLQKMGVGFSDSLILSNEKEMSDYFDETYKLKKSPRQISKWLLGDFLRYLNEDHESIQNSKVKPQDLAELIQLIESGDISEKMAKEVFQDMYKSGDRAESIVKKRGLKQITDTGALEKVIEEVLDQNISQVLEFKGGKDKLMGFFIGQVMKKTKGQANPDSVNKLLAEKLKDK